uniref:Uncharacterized protein n=1 Tax=Parascaris univalens TaxID=6257 RepID=A0A915ANV8_PARUN
MTSVSLRGLTLLALFANFCLWMAVEVDASGHRARRDDKPGGSVISDETEGVDPELISLSQEEHLNVTAKGFGRLYAPNMKFVQDIFQRKLNEEAGRMREKLKIKVEERRRKGRSLRAYRHARSEDSGGENSEGGPTSNFVIDGDLRLSPQL